MRFDPVVHVEEMVTVRIRIPAGLQDRYRKVAQEKGMELSDLYIQALLFAEGGDSTSNTGKTRKRRAKTPVEASDIDHSETDHN